MSKLERKDMLMKEKVTTASFFKLAQVLEYSPGGMGSLV
jgi:hypothetical protein